MAHVVDGGVLSIISPYVPVRLESTLAGFAVRAAPAIDDASRTTVHHIGLMGRHADCS